MNKLENIKKILNLDDTDYNKQKKIEESTQDSLLNLQDIYKTGSTVTFEQILPQVKQMLGGRHFATYRNNNLADEFLFSGIIFITLCYFFHNDNIGNSHQKVELKYIGVVSRQALVRELGRNALSTLKMKFRNNIINQKKIFDQKETENFEKIKNDIFEEENAEEKIGLRLLHACYDSGVIEEIGEPKYRMEEGLRIQKDMRIMSPQSLCRYIGKKDLEPIWNKNVYPMIVSPKEWSFKKQEKNILKLNSGGYLSTNENNELDSASQLISSKKNKIFYSKISQNGLNVINRVSKIPFTVNTIALDYTVNNTKNLIQAGLILDKSFRIQNPKSFTLKVIKFIEINKEELLKDGGLNFKNQLLKNKNKAFRHFVSNFYNKSFNPNKDKKKSNKKDLKKKELIEQANKVVSFVPKKIKDDDYIKSKNFTELYEQVVSSSSRASR